MVVLEVVSDTLGKISLAVLCVHSNLGGSTLSGRGYGDISTKQVRLNSSSIVPVF